MGFFDFLKKDKSIQNDKIISGKEYTVYIPKDSFSVGNVTIKGTPYVFSFNVNILKMEPKPLFRWFLSLAVKIDNPTDEGMPQSDNSENILDFCDYLDKFVKKNLNHPNAVYLGRLTGDGQIQIMWYVYDAELAHKDLQSIINSTEYAFNYEMRQDVEWKEAQYWIDPLI